MRGAFIALALIAFVVRALVPAGFMVAQAQGGQGPAIVICTGHGPLTLAVQGEHKAPPAKSRGDAPCVFTALGAPLASPSIPDLARPAAIIASVSTPMPADLLPGRGLAAPPPPSQGPPSLLI
ncbi:MAG: hypothetical protein P4L64_12330 [Caulobacteraceae bacterium]|nr:hypothetical protein [Caulobacteraceae bacterium]